MIYNVNIFRNILLQRIVKQNKTKTSGKSSKSHAQLYREVSSQVIQT